MGRTVPFSHFNTYDLACAVTHYFIVFNKVEFSTKRMAVVDNLHI